MIPTIDDLEMLNPFELGRLLHIVASKNSWESQDIQYIQDLLDVGCPIDYKGSKGWKALDYAAWNGKLEVVKFLVSKGADIHARNNFGRTALHNAAFNGQLEIVKYLISKGAEVNTRANDGRAAWDVTSKEIKEACPELEPK